MASINKAKQNISVTQANPNAVSHEGGRVAIHTDLQELKRSVLTCMLGENTFYESGDSIKNRIKELVAKVSATEAINVALDAKFKMKLRHVPLFVLREVMRKKDARVEAGKALEQIISRPDDMTEFVALYFAGEDKRITLPKQARLAMGRAFAKFDEYQLAKYKKDSKQVSLRDVARLVHPTTKDEALKALWGRLVKGTLATPDTWEVALSSGGDKKAVFPRLISEGKLGGMALLRNLRNMREAGVDMGFIKEAIKNIKTEKLLPKDLIMAYFTNQEFARELDAKFFSLFDNKSKFSGSTAVLVDCSGSMGGAGILGGYSWGYGGVNKSQMTPNNVAVALGILAVEMFEDSDIYAFGTYCKPVNYSRGFGLFKQVADMEPQTGSGTNIGEALEYAMKKRKYDRVIVVTDMQGHDSIVLPKGVKGYMLNVAPYQHSVAFGKWVHIDGQSDSVLDFIREYEAMSQ